jgi:ATP-dependent helicase/nuclease subunit A
MQLSPEQQPAMILDGCDIAVTAGAGTGKTRTLVARYLSLLAQNAGEHAELRSVVAVTFTRKAAREMRNRVRLAVQSYLQNGDLDAQERAHWRAHYAALDAARIGTIHSLCGEILRYHPAEAGIDPGFEMLSEGQTSLLRAQVVEETLGWIADSATLAPLFTLLGEWGVRRLVATLLARRLDLAETWARRPGGSDEPEPDPGLIARWQAMVDDHRERALKLFLEDPCFAESLATLRECVPLDPGDRMAQQRATVLAALGSGSRESAVAEAAIEALTELDSIDLRGGRQAAWRGGKVEAAEVKAALRALRELWRAHQDDLTLSLNERDGILADHIPLIRSAFTWADRRYAALKAERRALDFDDLEAGAVALLEAHPDVVATWQREISALLVDEFQDTNARQAKLLSLLNGERGILFTVGDAKQSIYRFRGADVTVFRHQMATSRAGDSDRRILNLTTSYRAHRRLLDLLNALLAPILGYADDPQRPYLEPFAPLTPIREAPVAGLQSPFVELHLTSGAKRDGALDRAAAALVQRIVTLVEQTPDLDYGSVAILCRASSAFAPYEDALEAAGVPFLTVSGRGFYERPEVRDVLNALRAIGDPTDDLALVGLLRSPTMGLSDIALYRLVRAREITKRDSLWQVLSGELDFLNEEAAAARRARVTVTELNTLAGRVPVADVLKAFLDATGYRAALRQSRQTRAVVNLDKLLADAHTSEIVEMGAFLEYVQQLRDVGTREGEAHVLEEGTVQLMTIHAAKGLEFPVVAIGDISRTSPEARGALIDPRAGFVLPLKGPVPDAGDEEVTAGIFRLVKAREQDQEAAESDRLLYVAMTRARDHLLISGAMGTRLTGWLECLGQALELNSPSDFTDGWDADGDRVHTVTLDLGGSPVGLYVYPEAAVPAVSDTRFANRRQADWVKPADMPMLQRFEPDFAEADDASEAALRDPPRRVWRVVPEERAARAPSWVVGQIVHSALERWLFPGTSPGFWPWADAEAKGCGIADEREARNAVRRAATMLDRFQSTALFEQMDSAARMYRELPYSIEISDGKLESGVIDALFESAGTWSLVEFKTDRIRDVAHLERLLKEEQNDYVRQVGYYLTAVERILGRRPRPVLCFLNCGGAVRLVMDRW